MTQDPIKLAGGLNQYAYVDGNPVNWVAPLGLFAVDKSGAEEILARTDGVPVLPEAGKGAIYKVSNGANTSIPKSDLAHPIVQSRINIKTGVNDHRKLIHFWLKTINCAMWCMTCLCVPRLGGRYRKRY